MVPAHREPAPTTRAGVLVAVLLFVVAAGLVAVVLIGDLSEAVDPAYADHLWRPAPLLVDHEAEVAVVSFGVLVVAGAVLVVARRSGRLPPPRLAQTVVLTVLAGWLAFAYRVTTAGVTGANIGGGFIVLTSPVVVIATAALVVGLSRRAARRRNRGC